MSKVKGLKEVNLNLDLAVKGIKFNIHNGMKGAVKVIKVEASEVTPVERFSLIRSIASRIRKTALSSLGVVGYKSPYAAAVHEMGGKLKGVRRPSGIGRHWDPDSSPKFFLKAILANKRKIVEEFRKEGSKSPKGKK